MSVKLVVKHRSEAGGADKGVEHVLEDAAITIGRDKACQVVLPEQAVSRSHARISRDGALFFVEDLGSAYGTQVNGKKLPKGEKRLLRNGDVIAIAQFDVTFDRVVELAPSGEKTSYVARQVVKDVMKGLGGDGPFFRIMNGPEEGKRIELSDGQELIIGRDPTADVVFDKDDLISRRHCKVRRDWSGTHVEDLQSRNGIKVNKKRITRKTLRDRDELQVGNVRLLYLDPSEVRETAGEEPAEMGEMTEPPRPKEPPPPEPAAEPPPEPEAASEPEAQAAEPEPDAAPSEPQAEAAPDAPPADGSELPPDLGAMPEAAAMEAAPSDELIGNPRSRMIALAVMGVFALIAIGILIAVFAGA